MMDGRRAEEWQHTAHLCAVIHNTQCAKRSELAKPADFNPYLIAQAARRKSTDSAVDRKRASIECLKAFLPRGA